MRFTHRHALMLTILSLLVSPAVLAGTPRHYPRGAQGGPIFANEFRLRLGMFTPEGDSNFWEETHDVFTGSVDDFEDTSFAADFLLRRSERLGVMFTLGFFEGDSRQHYRDYVDDMGGEIVHNSELQIMPATIALVGHLAGPEATLRPYVGAGVGFYWWDYREAGDFIDFEYEEVVPTSFESDGIAFGYFLLAGVDIPIQPNWSVFLEGRWSKVDDDLADDFEDSANTEIDLSGTEISGGVSFRF